MRVLAHTKCATRLIHTYAMKTCAHTHVHILLHMRIDCEHWIERSSLSRFSIFSLSCSSCIQIIVSSIKQECWSVKLNLSRARTQTRDNSRVHTYKHTTTCVCAHTSRKSLCVHPQCHASNHACRHTVKDNLRLLPHILGHRTISRSVLFKLLIWGT